jgi:hypothetical protein
METLKIEIFESGKSKPDQAITIPLSKLNVGKQLLPTKTKTILEKEGIDISNLSELTGKSISKGSLIEVESGKEKLVISVE